METSPIARAGAGLTGESPVSALSWAAIIAGAVVAAAVALLLMTLGAGMGLAAVSPWPGSGASATTFTAITAIWFVVAQWAASGFGGYLAGRMRTRWSGLHTHEVFFRDTAHGFITWALATLIAVAFFTSAATSLVGHGMHAVASVAGGAAQSTAATATESVTAEGVAPYDIDLLFRSGEDADRHAGDVRAEAARILARDIASGDVSASDRAYLAKLVAAHTGASQEEAQKRVDTVISDAKAAATRARLAADAARKAAAEAATYTALSMLVGAFIACVAAALGGKRRDEHA